MDALFTFLGYEVKIWCAVLFPAAVAALFLMRQYRVTALKSSTVEPRFGAYFAWAAGLSLVGMVLALGMWGLVIRPLQPPTVDAALLTKYMRYEIFERVGIASQYPELSDEETQTPPEQTQQANEPEQQEDAPEQAQAPVEPETSEEPSPAQAESSLWNPAETETVQSVSYAQDMTAWLVVLIVLLVILLASVPFLRRLWRRQRLDALCRGTSQEQVVGLYRFYLKKFARIGYPRGPNQTEWEYAARYGEQLAPFLEGGPDLERMTALYMDARYGGLAASEEDCRAMAVLYPAFLRNYKELAGRMRYWKYYFVL